MFIEYGFVKRKMERQFLLGLCPQIEFEWREHRYGIFADSNFFYVQKAKKREVIAADSYDYIELSKHTSFDELYQQGVICDIPIIEIWNEFEFVNFDDELLLNYELMDNVRIISRNIYGQIWDIVDDSESVQYGVLPEGDNHITFDNSKYIYCKAEDLEYDDREEIIDLIRESYLNFLQRISE